jgi:hypothetical protein
MVIGSNSITADFGLNRDRNANSRGAILTNKYRLKCVIIAHVSFVLLMTFRLSVALYVLAGIRPPRYLQRLRIPPTRTWEFVWLFGNVVTCLLGLLSMWRWRPTLVRLYAAGTFFAGLLPALYAAGFDVREDLIQYWNTHQAKLTFQGVPVVLLWGMFLAAAVQLHFYGFYFAWSLLSAWKQRTNAARLKTT